MYADFQFYQSEYYGNTIAEADWPRFASRASDFLDYATGNKMVDNLPTDTTSADKVKKACCAVADALAEMERATATGASLTGGDGIVKSISSGGESVSFELSAAVKAATDGPQEKQRYLYGVAKSYLSLVSDDAGNYYLYRGLD